MKRNIIRERKKVNILVGICSAQKYYERRKAVRETWLKHPQKGVECLFFLGGEVPEDEKKDTVGLDAPDSYIGLPAKVLAFFRYALEHYEFDWLFKCDEDTYLDLSRLQELADPKYGIVGDALLARRNAPSGGAGYLLRREIVERIAARQDVPVCGAEDLIFGKLALEEGAVPHSTPRLYMSNAHYPAPDNDEVSAHWCNPDLMKTFEVLRHGTPAALYRGRHEKWTDDLIFYKEGVFRRRSTSGYGWWSLSPCGILTLRWKDGKEEQFLTSEKGYSGSNLELSPANDSVTLVKLAPENGADNDILSEDEVYKTARLHLGCGERQLKGWLNLDLPRYDITRPLPWANGSVKVFYLEHVIEYVSPEELYQFLREVRRTLQPDGILRLSVTDMVRHTTEALLNYAPFRQQQTGVSSEPDWALEALIGHDKKRSFWTQESLGAFLKLAGFAVTAHEPGQSHDPDLQGLERRENPTEDPFLLMGTVCLEARPKISPVTLEGK